MKVVARLLVLLPLLWVDVVWAVDCPYTSYSLSYQSEVNALAATGCTVVLGDLTIINSSDIYNLDALTSIVEVGGTLTISGNVGLLNLDGLSNLARVSDLYVSDNSSLQDLNGLVGLTSLSGLVISSNPRIISLEGLHRLSAVRGSIKLSDNAGLQTLHGLRALNRIEDTLTIRNNDALKNIDGLANLTFVGGSISSVFIVTPSVSGGNGIISPSSPQTVQENGKTTFTLYPDQDYLLDSVIGCAGALNGTTYTTGAVTSDCSVIAKFEEFTGGAVEYCAGATSDVECSSSKTLDPLGDSRVWQQVAPDSNRVTNGKILSVPFTYKGAGSTRDVATMKMNSNMAALRAGFQFNVWISRIAAGSPLASGKCQHQYTDVHGKYLTLRDQGGNYSCGLAAGEVYHANFEVRCSSDATTTNSSYNSAVPESVWAAGWVTSTAYKVGDKVSYSGRLYEAKQLHASSDSRKPSGVASDSALWKYLQAFNPKTLPVCPDKTLRWNSDDYGVTGGYYFEFSSF